MSTLVSASDLTVRLGGRVALRQLSFDLPSGALLAVMGPNGSGKSTLVRTLAGLVAREGGSVSVLDRDPVDVPVGRVGYVPQIKSLDRTFPARALDLVASATHARWPARTTEPDRARALAALDRVGAAHLADRQVGRLSGGELQRVYLARSVMRDPQLLLLDEPETGIDPGGTADLYEQLDAFRADGLRGIVLVTHDFDVALHHASHVLLLRTEQVSFGSPEKALTDACVRAAFGHVGHRHATTGVHRHD